MGGYLDKRIIGLVSAVHVSGSAWQSKTTYEYDSTDINSQALETTHHYSSYSTTTPRGNVTKVYSWDVTDITTFSKALRRALITYDTAGSIMATADHLGHETLVEYSDSFAYAYPTKVKDPDYHASTAPYNYSTAQYDFDTGAVTQTQGARPSGQSAAMAQSMSYDSVGRLQWITRSDGFWKYIAYADRGDAVMSQVSLTAYPDSAWSITVVDGAGRTRLVGGDHPGSTNGYAAAFTLYDNMGRVSQQSNLEETNAYWSPAGDDSAGWVWTEQTYDWKGRPLTTTNPDSTTKEAIYGGCGCAGGAVVVTRDEVGRRQKTTFDPLGRLKKTEILYEQSMSTALDGSGTVYSTSENTLDALDHVTQVTQTNNANSVNQVTTMGYDGYGRLHTKHLPEQSANTATTYAYNDDDTIHVVTDARGASATYSYNNRHLVHTIEYYAPSGVSSTPNVTFEYDAAGNRTSASSSVGTSTYSYDSLSRLTSESYQFGDISGTYTLNYAYNLGGELTSLSIPFTSQSIGYSYDSTGRLSSMSASGFSASYSYTQTVSSFISSIAYRAWGAPKSVTYGNTVSEATDYNSRLQPTSYALSNVNYTNYNASPSTNYSSMSWTFDYYDDGRVHNAWDASNHWFDRSYTYNHAARLIEASTYRRAEGLSPYPSVSNPDPYYQQTTYDVWGHITNRTGKLYTGEPSDSASYTNNRRQYWGYDANGNVLGDGHYQHTFDAAGRSSQAISNVNVGDGSSQFPTQPNLEITQNYDGDGVSRKRVQISRQNIYDEWDENHPLVQVLEDNQTSYYLKSSVLGGARVMELDASGAKKSIWIYAGGQRIAKEENGSINFEHHNPATGSWVTTHGHSSFRLTSREERDPFGAETPTSNPYPSGESYLEGKWGQPLFIEGGDPFDYSSGQEIDGLPVSASEFARRTGNGSVGAGIFLNGNQIGYVDLTGRNFQSHISVTFDVFRSGQRTRTPDNWLYEGSFTEDFSLPYGSAGHEFHHGGSQPQNTSPIARVGSSAAGTTPYSQTQIEAAIDNCAQSYFSVRLDSFDPTSKGHNGTFNGTDLDASPEGSNITVVNDVRSF